MALLSDVHGFIRAVTAVPIEDHLFSADRANLRASSFRGPERNISDMLCRLEDECLKKIGRDRRLEALPVGLRILRLQDNSAAVVRLTRPRPDDHPDYIEVSIMTCHFFTEYKWARIACLVGTAALLVGVTAVVVLNCPPLMALVTQLLEMPQQQVFGGLPEPIITQLEAFFCTSPNRTPAGGAAGRSSTGTNSSPAGANRAWRSSPGPLRADFTFGNGGAASDCSHRSQTHVEHRGEPHDFSSVPESEVVFRLALDWLWRSR